MKKVLITGAAGFLGSHLCDRFLKEGCEVIGMDNLLTGNIKNIEHLFPREDFTFYHHDVTKFVHVPEKLDYIFPYLDFFTANLHKVHLESSVRPLAKICELLVISYYSKEANTTKEAITTKNLEQITEACFDWLIGDYKVAPKAYSMTSLLLLGRTYDWVHPELKNIVEQNYATGSAAYKARGRMVLAKIKSYAAT